MFDIRDGWKVNSIKVFIVFAISVPMSLATSYITAKLVAQEVVSSATSQIIFSIDKQRAETLSAVDKQRAETLSAVDKQRAETLSAVNKQRADVLAAVNKQRADVLVAVDNQRKGALDQVEQKSEQFNTFLTQLMGRSQKRQDEIISKLDSIASYQSSEKNRNH